MLLKSISISLQSRMNKYYSMTMLKTLYNISIMPLNIALLALRTLDCQYINYKWT